MKAHMFVVMWPALYMPSLINYQHPGAFVFHLPLNLHAPHKEGKRKIKVNMNLPLNASYIIRKYM